MRIFINVREALINLFSSKLRSALALLGILVGTASVVAMVSGGELATNEALKQFKVLGTNLLAVSINEAPSEDQGEHRQEYRKSHIQANLTLQQVLQLSSVDQSIVGIAPYTQIYNPIQYEGHVINGSVLGITESFARIMRIDLLSGRFVSSLDKQAFFCVIGDHVYQEIKKTTFADPLGQQIQIGQNFFTIIGIAKPWLENSFLYANVDDAVLVPILASLVLSQSASINNIILQLSPRANIDTVDSRIRQYVNHEVVGKRLFFRSAKELIASMGKQSQILTVFLGLIGSVSLLVGGIGVMNIMLVSVVERRREIGIRLAVGASRADIRGLFLTEAIMLSLLGGSLGIIVGVIIAYVIALFWHWEFILFLWPPLIGFGVSVAIGIFFGFYPAHRASRLDPIEALRSE
jgi:putative ABC transport system permease protein